MGLRHELRRAELDRQADEHLVDEQGRERFWEALRGSCGKDSMISLLESTLHLPGDVIECGVYRGGTLQLICRAIAEHAPEKAVFACDSFAGFPQDKVGHVDVGFLRLLSRVRGKFRHSGDTPARLRRFFRWFNIFGHIVQGYFSDTLTRFAGHQFCFIHLDCDIYESYRECLHGLFDKLVPGGVVVFDDYGSPRWPGAKRAVDEFFADKTESPSELRDREKPAWYVRKQAVAARTDPPGPSPASSRVPTVCR